MRARRFKQVDVFTRVPYAGNPVAVVLDAEGLDTARMQAIARWTNLSETTFVLPPEDGGADYRLRIFTPGAELPFAGHPTLGSAHALLEWARSPGDDAARWRPLAERTSLRQACGAGVIPLEVERPGARLWLGMPPAAMRVLGADERDRLADALGGNAVPCDGATAVDVGPIWIVTELADAAQVLALEPDLARLAALSRELGVTGVTVFGRHAHGECAYEVRSFAPAHGVPEDPVCGSGNGSVAHWLRARGRDADYHASQGGAIGRDGRIAVRYVDGRPHIGGECVTCVDGTIVA